MNRFFLSYSFPKFVSDKKTNMGGTKKGDTKPKPKFNYYSVAKGTKPINRPK
jgi:hypothetical protein